MRFGSLPLIVALTAASACTTTKGVVTRKCEVYAIVPPQHANPEASDYILASWRKRARKNLGKCDRFVEQRRAKDVLATLGMGFDRPFNWRTDLNTERAGRIAAETKATRLVVLRYKVEGRRLVVGPAIYDLKPPRLVKERELNDEELAHVITVALPRSNPLKDTWMNDLKAALARLVPNAITFGAGRPVVSNERDTSGDLEEVSNERQTLLPEVLTAFGVTNIDHRNAFNTWDADFSLASNVRIMADDGRLTYKPRGDRVPLADEDLDYQFTFFALAATINGRASLYSPLGTTVLSFGLGFAPLRFQDDGGTNATRVDFITRIVIAQRMFFAERWYFEFSADSVTFDRDLARTEVFKTDTVQTAFFGFGWFFPRGRYLGL